MTKQLRKITLSGVMQGPIWWPTGEVCDITFGKHFSAPGEPHSPWSDDWPGMDEAMQAALASGDFQGGMGNLVYGTICFLLSDDKGRTSTISKPLERMAAARAYLA